MRAEYSYQLEAEHAKLVVGQRFRYCDPFNRHALIKSARPRLYCVGVHSVLVQDRVEYDAE